MVWFEPSIIFCTFVDSCVPDDNRFRIFSEKSDSLKLFWNYVIGNLKMQTTLSFLLKSDNFNSYFLLTPMLVCCTLL